MDTEQACGLVDKAIDALGRVEVADLDGEGMRAVTDRLRGARTHVAHLDTALATRASDLAPTGTCEDPVDLLSGAGAMPAGRARRVARNAELLGRMPELAAAFTAVAVTEDHVDAVATARRRVDSSVRQAFDSLDADITGYAAVLANLVPLCHRHHHLVHDAGWHLHLDRRDRTLTFTRPDGTIHSQTRPPGLRPPADAGSGVRAGPPGTASTTAA